MFEFYSIIPLLGLFLGIFSIVIILIKQQQPFYRKVLFLTFVFSISYYCFTIFTVNSGKLINWPHVFRTGSPFFYLISISFYLLGKAYLHNKKSPKLVDFILLGIPVLHIFELLPFYLKSSSEKIIIIESFIYNTGGIYKIDTSFISTNLHYTLQGLMSIISSGLILLGTSRAASKENKSVLKFSLSWLFLMALAIFVLFSIAVFAYVVLQLDGYFFQHFISVYFAVTLLLILFLIFLKPSVLYGINPVEATSKKHIDKNVLKPLNLNKDEIEELNSSIEKYFKTNREYLSSEFRLQDLANSLGINKNLLSQVINTVYQQNFNQLLNTRRIEFLLEKLDNPEWSRLTFEGMANNIGFKSRTTFNKAFKDKTGLSPSEFIKRHQP